MRVPMSWRWSVVMALLGLGSLSLPVALSSQSAERTVYAAVLTKDGMPVTDLTARDFIVRENDLEREVLRVSRATDPFQMAVLVDNSEALNPYLVDVRAGLAEFIREMGGQNEIALVGFGQRPTILVDYTRDVKKLSDGASRVFPETLSGGYLLDAILEIGRGLKKREGGRRAMVVIGTTRGQEFSERYHRYVLDELRDSGATLHAYMIGPANSLIDDNARERSLTLDQGARMTGGRQEDLLTSSSLPGKMRELAAEIKNQYAVVYSRPQSLVPPDSIDVGVRRPELVVRAQRVLPK
jgi:Ca-activated chloride channel family protein